MKPRLTHNSYWMAERWEVPPFYSTGEDEERPDSPANIISLHVESLPGRYVPRFSASVRRSEWEPLWLQLLEANSEALGVVKLRDTEYEKAKKVPLLGRFLADIKDAQTMNSYYRVEGASWEASRALLLLVERSALGTHREHATRYLDMHVSDFGARRGVYNPRNR